MDQSKLEELKYIFHPKSVAVLGVSGNGDNAGTKFFRALLTAGFKGKVYAVNPTGGRVDDCEIYHDVKSIPEEVDNAIIAVPARAILGAIDDCVAKGVKATQIYTAGFRETGLEQGYKLEEALVEKARSGGVHIVGPNCMGVYSPAVNLPYGMTPFIGKIGTIAFFSQSGGLGGLTLDMGITAGLQFNKVVSFGNGSDLDAVDYLEYFAEDPEVKIIATYLEGLRRGPRFLKLARELFHKKPLIIWRGGKTEVGAKTAASHTGALASPDILWTAAIKQVGAVRVENIEETVDTMLVFQQLGQWKGKGVAFVSGITGGGGGIGVTASDIFSSFGLQLPAFSEATQRRLIKVLPPVGTIVHNPLDIGGGAPPPQVLYEVFSAVLEDPSIDILVFHERTSNFLSTNYVTRVEAVNEALARLRNSQSKPMAVISIPGTAEGRIALEKKLEQPKIPVFPTVDRAAVALRNVSQYWNRESKE